MSQKNTNIVDVFIPYWGKFSLLKETVDSVMAQTNASWHLTILDDHEPSEEAYEYYTQLADSRITYIRHKKNLGITQNFNFAIKAATAPYCMIVGCDDRLLPHYIETMLKNIGEADFYQPAVDVIDSNGNTYLPLGDRVKRLLEPKKAGIYYGEKLATSLCQGDWLYFPAITWKTSTLQRYSFNSKYKIVEDLDLIFRMIIDGAKLCLNTDTSFQYRRFSESLSSREKDKNGIRFREEHKVYYEFISKFNSMNWRRASLMARIRPTSRLHEVVSRFIS